MKSSEIIRAVLRGAEEVVFLNCRAAARLQSEALDHSLPRAQRLALRIHLTFCRWCRRYGRHLRMLGRLAAHRDQALEHHPAPLMPAAVRERIGKALRAPPGPSPPPEM